MPRDVPMTLDDVKAALQQIAQEAKELGGMCPIPTCHYGPWWSRHVDTCPIGKIESLMWQLAQEPQGWQPQGDLVHLTDVMRVWMFWKGSLQGGSFKHEDGLRFVKALDDLLPSPPQEKR